MIVERGIPSELSKAAYAKADAMETATTSQTPKSKEKK